MKYTHINANERILIEKFLKRGDSINKIPSELRWNPSTISREIKRNFDSKTMTYNFVTVNNLANQRRYYRFYFYSFLIKDKYEKFNEDFFNIYDRKIWTV